MTYDIVPIQVVPGMQPITDFTEQSTPHYVNADKIRFVDGFAEKIGGWDTFSFNDDITISGCPRGLFSYILDSRIQYLIGTNSHLYSLLASQLTNITPLVTATTAIANSLDTYFQTLANDPITTVISSTTLTIADTATKIRINDTIELSGSTAVNGVPAIEINTAHVVRSQSTNLYTIRVATAATSSGSGGGAVVVQATPILQVNQTAHDFVEGDRVLIAGSTAVGGIPAVEINAEHIIRNVITDDYDIVATTQATSSVTGGGGASTTVQGQIEEGQCDATAAFGYGAGLYGVGLYGVSKTSTGTPISPRLWAFDRFGDLTILTPGNQTGLYSWDSLTAVAPALVTNAPTAINYCFTSNEIAVTLGSTGVGNRIQWSDQGNLTVWTATAQNQAGEDDIEGADDFISHVKLRGFNLLFTESQVYSFRYIGGTFVWETKLLDNSRGLIAQNARVAINGIAYWMGDENFYFYRGGNVEIIPSNTTTQTTIKKFIFDNINRVQKDKIFSWYNEIFDEIWWHIPSASSNEPDIIARLNIKDFTWVADTLDRTAAEYPKPLNTFPYLLDINGIIYRHENGDDDLTNALPFSIKHRFEGGGTDRVRIGGVAPDSIQTGNVQFSINVKEYAQSPEISTKGPFTVTPTTDRIGFNADGRWWQYEISGNDLGQSWRNGIWQQELQLGTRR